MTRWLIVAIATVMLASSFAAAQEKIPLQNASFEDPPEKGQVPPKWISRLWAGECDLQRSDIGHSGKHSALLIGRTATKMRIWQEQELEPGRYRVTAYMRGFDIGLGQWRIHHRIHVR